MEIKELIRRYDECSTTADIADQLRQLGSKIHAKGLVGSSESLLINSVQRADRGIHVVVLTDNEEAAFRLNDLENLNPETQHVLFFPSSYKSAYELEKTDNANVVLRAEVLERINRGTRNMIVVTYPKALAEKVISKQELSTKTMHVKVGESYSIDFINELLIEYHFDKVDFVYEPGQFSVRGGIVDVFSFSNDHPYRIEFYGDEVDSIRQFDPVVQLSLTKMDSIAIVPNVQDSTVTESYQSFLNYIPESATIWINDVELARDQIGKELRAAEIAYKKLRSELKRAEPEEIRLAPDKFQEQLDRFSLIETGNRTHYVPHLVVTPELSAQPVFKKNFELLSDDLNSKLKDGYENVVVASNSKQIERLYNIFEDRSEAGQGTIAHPFKPVLLGLHEGFIDHDLKISCYTDHQIFERHHRFRLKEGFARNKQAITLKELNQLQKGDYVTHSDHGVGQFSGLEKIDVNGKHQEAIRLIYKGGDIVYVNIHSLHRISKYTGKEGSVPTLNKIGSNAWKTVKQKTKRKVKELAFDLIKLYAKRKASKGFAYTPDSYLQTELEASFMYEDTPDQLKATQAVKKDMEAEYPMDRLVCGDVGFGKTEIAIRAAFKAVADSKQVMVLAPTTILTLQHYHTFSERLKGMPCRVDYLNRFKSAAKQKETTKDFTEGKVDILVGTHRLIGKDVVPKDLGLLIIDEEQKFGVSTKDKLKTIKENIDTLTMTATPIPRTLQFSMMGARDLSIINTAPPNRQAVQTEVHTFSEELIRDAIRFELARGGQVFFVHNRVQNIEEVAGMIQRLFPKALIRIGHGQMEGSKLEKVMVDFIEGEFDILVATTIIESGIDIPNANTIIINEAHMFGLSDLHQLRGRVGRSNKKAFCYLLAPPSSTLTTEARKRLNAIEQFSDLGSGFNIAMRDLDIRGAGNLLGAEQSGFISDIGFEMYQKILDEAMHELKEKEFKELFKEEEREFIKDCVIETDMEILIPDDYVEDITERLALYKTLDDLETEEGLEKFQEELIDRFGPIPQPVEDLFETLRIRWLAKEIGFEKLVLKSEKLLGYFIPDQESDYFQSPQFARVLGYIQANPSSCRMKERKGKLMMAFDQVSSVHGALLCLQHIHESEAIQTG